MNKSEFIGKIAKVSGLTQKQSAAAFDAMVEVIEATLKENDSISIAGFATFEIKEKPEREGINPATQEKIMIPASKTPVVKFGKAFKDKFNQN